jgi:hypothetical protein
MIRCSGRCRRNNARSIDFNGSYRENEDNYETTKTFFVNFCSKESSGDSVSPRRGLVVGGPFVITRSGFSAPVRIRNAFSFCPALPGFLCWALDVER